MKTDILSQVKTELESKGYDAQAVLNYITYLQEASTEQKNNKLVNAWMNGISAAKYTFLFMKVAATGLYLDGESIRLTYLGRKVGVSYDYRAYKNKVMAVYPDSLFDFQIVKEGDEFYFNKANGKVDYQHKILSAFNTNAKIIGAYGVIKNSRGEFLELLNADDIAKIRKTAKTDYIWKAWEDRMIKKSVIKRACKTHFHDITDAIDQVDNAYNYDLKQPKKETQEELNKREEIKRAADFIAEAKTIEQLEQVKQYVEENHDKENCLMSLYNQKVFDLNEVDA